MVVVQNLRTVLMGLVVDPATFVLIGSALTAVALVAAYLPVRRGTRVDPAVTLKAE
jgi:ABC-type lipoprotein release transport system permease subunit